MAGKIKDYGNIPDKCPPSSRRHGIMLAQPLEEKRLQRWNHFAIVQPKLDGERCRAIIDHGKVTLVSSEENEITSVPHINFFLQKAFPDLRRFELDGELYNHEMDFDTISGIVSRTVNLHPDYAAIEYHVFDVVNKDPQYLRINELFHEFKVRNLDQHTHICAVQTTTAEGISEVMAAFDHARSRGYEGIILRHPAAPFERKRSLWMMKFKPKKSDDYEVVGYVEEVDKYGSPKGRLGALKVRGADGTVFGVGSGLTDTDRRTLWDDRENLYGRICEVSYQHRNASGVPRFPVFVNLYEKGTSAEARTPEGFKFG